MARRDFRAAYGAALPLDDPHPVVHLVYLRPALALLAAAADSLGDAAGAAGHRRRLAALAPR